MGARRSLEERFFEKVIKSENPDNCWSWSASKVYGYGYIGTGTGKRGRAKSFRAHRVSWQIHFGPIPEGMLVCHKCDNRECCNPKHLFLGTNKDNMQDCKTKGRFSSRKGENNYAAKLTNAQVDALKSAYAALPVGKSGYKKRKGTVKKLATEFGISRKHVGAIVQGKRRA